MPHPQIIRMNEITTQQNTFSHHAIVLRKREEKEEY
jgi:hypothetical protein